MSAVLTTSAHAAGEQIAAAVGTGRAPPALAQRLATPETAEGINAELLAALKEVVRISDRDHVAWHAAHAAIARAEGR